MLTRRHMLLASIAAGALMQNRDVLAKAAQPATPVNFDIPAGACDCHTHIHGDVEKFPFFAGRVYTPEPASPEEMSALHKALHMERVVVVTPSVYGTDNSSSQYGMMARGASARGVAVIDDKTPESALDTMHKVGFRGIRLNLATGGVNDPNVGRPRFTAAVERMKARGWHVQLYTSLPMIIAIKDLVLTAPVPVVFDHFGGAQAALGVEQPGFSDLVELVKSGKAYVKISGAYRSSKLGPDYQDCVPLAKALIEANADRIVWGTDWPHPDSVTPPGRKVTDVTPLFQIDDGRLLNQLPVWAPDAACARRSWSTIRRSSTGSERHFAAPFAAPLAVRARIRAATRRPCAGRRTGTDGSLISPRSRPAALPTDRARHRPVRCRSAAGRTGRSARAAPASNCRCRSAARILSASPASPAPPGRS